MKITLCGALCALPGAALRQAVNASGAPEAEQGAGSITSSAMRRRVHCKPGTHLSAAGRNLSFFLTFFLHVYSGAIRYGKRPGSHRMLSGTAWPGLGLAWCGDVRRDRVTAKVNTTARRQRRRPIHNPTLFAL